MYFSHVLYHQRVLKRERPPASLSSSSQVIGSNEKTLSAVSRKLQPNLRSVPASVRRPLGCSAYRQSAVVRSHLRQPLFLSRRSLFSGNTRAFTAVVSSVRYVTLPLLPLLRRFFSPCKLTCDACDSRGPHRKLSRSEIRRSPSSPCFSR